MPVVLEVGGEGNIVPVPAGLNGVFFILLGIAKQEVGKVIAREVAVKIELTFGVCEVILDLLIESPAESHL